MYVDDAVHIEKTDQCYDCRHFIKGAVCPLLEALALGMVEMVGDICVQNCGFYDKLERALSIVETEETEEIEQPDRDQAATRPPGEVLRFPR